MAKKIYAVTGVKLGSGPGQTLAAGEEVKPSELGLSKAQLLELHAAGAVEIRDDAPVVEAEVDESGETLVPSVNEETKETEE